MYKRITLLLTISNGVFSKTRLFNPEHIYSISHINFSYFDEVILVCTDNNPDKRYFNFVESVVKKIGVPLAISGNIRNLDDAKNLFKRGADRIIVNRLLWKEPNLIKEISNKYGKQAIIASIDFGCFKEKYLSFDWVSKKYREQLIPDYFYELESYIGEILLQDVDQDGRVMGPNLKAIKEICNKVSVQVPVHIGSCGLVSWDQYCELLKLDYIAAVSVTNIHHMSVKSINSLRRYSIIEEINIRNVIL
tara:strand:+ start:1141 stop:1887 length:747 start_codon:yes stop_codon:yes gene_type:complete